MTLEYKGISIYYTDQGQGEPVVFLHGFLENTTMWTPFLPTLSKNNRIICIDLLGHGNTENLGYIHTMELMAECVKAVLNHLKIDKATFIGHSMGGYVALAFAEAYENLVSGLCLMNSTAEADSPEKQINRVRAIKAVKENYKLFVKQGVLNLFRPKNRSLFSEDIKQVTEEALKTSLQGIIAALEGMKIRKDRTQILKNSNFKKMMIISKKDPVLVFENLINQTLNTDVIAEIFPDGHMCHIENKALFTEKVLSFIE